MVLTWGRSAKGLSCNFDIQFFFIFFLYIMALHTTWQVPYICLRSAHLMQFPFVIQSSVSFNAYCDIQFPHCNLSLKFYWAIYYIEDNNQAHYNSGFISVNKCPKGFCCNARLQDRYCMSLHLNISSVSS